MAFSPDGRLLATAGDDETVRIWDRASGRLLHVLTGHGGPVTSVAFRQDGARLASGSDDGTARIWDCSRGRTVAVAGGPNGAVTSVAFHPDGDRVLVASTNGAPSEWHIGAEQTGVAASHDPDMAAVDIAGAPSGSRVAVALDDGRIVIWDAASRQAERVLPAAGSVNDIAFSPGGDRLVAAGASADGQSALSRVFDVGSGRVVTSLIPPDGEGGESFMAAFGPGGRTVTIVSWLDDREEAVVWDLATGRSSSRLDVENALALSSDGTMVATMGDRLLVVDVASGRTRTEFADAHDVIDVVFDPPGERVLLVDGEDRPMGRRSSPPRWRRPTARRPTRSNWQS